MIILNFSKLEANKLALEKTTFSLYDELKSIAKLITYKAEEKKIRLYFDISPDTPRLLVGDPLRLKQALLNLLTNAIKFTERGSIRLTVEPSMPAIDQQQELSFRVQDSGIGIDAALIEKIYEPFSQADNSTTRQFGGTGLGLSISQGLVKLMGGKIKVSSQPGYGSIFSFHLTFTCPETTETPVFQPLPRSRVLIIDTDSLITRLVKSRNIEVTSVDSLSKLAEPLSDYTHIIINCYNLAIACRDMVFAVRKSCPETPLLILDTLTHQDELSTLDISVNAPAFLEQPVFDPDVLINALFVDKQTPDEKTWISVTETVTGNHQQCTVLVVDDVAINRLLIRELLEDSIGQILEARNGTEALNLLQRQSVDLVLMDIQMPVMDGYSATKKIRSDLKLDIPIIAMTAFAGDLYQNKCLASGMNNFLVKPIDFSLLTKLIAHYIPTATSLKEIPGKPADIPDLPGIDVNSGIARAGGNPDTFYRLLKKFNQDCVQFQYQIPQLLNDQCWQEAEELSHKLKGICANLAMTDLAESCAQINENCKLALNNPHLQQKFMQQFRLVLDSIQRIPIADIFAQQPAGTDKLKATLLQLEQPIARHSIDCDNLLTDLIRICPASDLGYCKKLQRAIYQFEFKQAGLLLAEWLEKLEKHAN